MRIRESVPLSEIVYYHIGGIARFVIEVYNLEEIREAINFLRSHHEVKIYILGLGSNTLFPDDCSTLGVIWLRESGAISFQDESITAFAGESLDSIITFSLNNKQVGLEWAGGLPSTIGGAVRGNAGAFGSEIKNNVISVDAIDMSDSKLLLKSYSKDECGFSYRNSYFKQNSNLLITSVVLATKNADEIVLKNAKNTYLKNIDYRANNHPIEYPSCGSVFKNIVKKEEVEKIISVWTDVKSLSESRWHNKISMGYVINRLGFSGKKVGDAMISPKHTNYIVNLGHATAQDVRILIDQVRESFYHVFGFYPEPEVIIL
ncbi:MAG: UDP-N-acetylmuramate dehydrogenase [Candidatus Levybacteria bacterium]|nr:UDP-N-acetylmuramate dehydrogenase [Candidatus Levybacteria bacterium]